MLREMTQSLQLRVLMKNVHGYRHNLIDVLTHKKRETERMFVCFFVCLFFLDGK